MGRFETNSVSIERINEYCNIAEEDEWIKPYRPEIDWPQKEKFKFQGG